VDVFNPRALLMLAPVMPAPTGNGLAMRAGAQLRALSERYDVMVVVVPVAGGSLDAAWAERHASSVEVVVDGDPAELRAGLMRLVGDATWRDRLRRSEPFPAAVAAAGPALAGAVAAAAGGIRQARVHALRSYLAPLAVAVSELVDAPWTTLDLDDDDEHLLTQEGRRDEAEAYGRILATFGPEFRWLSLAAAGDAARVAERHGLPTAVVPNSVTVPPVPGGRSRREAGRASLLYVGNLTYGPNAEAAELLAREILPHVRRLTGRTVGAVLAGRFEAGGRVEALGACDGVEVRGHVDDLDDVYARADVAVVPLERGSGTRIKLLEALAAGVPVVTTAVGAAGLGAEHGRHLLIADNAGDLAAAAAQVLLDERLAGELARQGRAFVEQRFSGAAVGRQLLELTTALEPALTTPPRSRDEPAGDEL
jgi:glycosyltransferase involved in cell wall biosynthesis